jgi:hypothetical protein
MRCARGARALTRHRLQGVKIPRHRAKLVALAGDMLLFRSPSELSGALRCARQRTSRCATSRCARAR